MGQITVTSKSNQVHIKLVLHGLTPLRLKCEKEFGGKHEIVINVTTSSCWSIHRPLKCAAQQTEFVTLIIVCHIGTMNSCECLYLASITREYTCKFFAPWGHFLHLPSPKKSTHAANFHTYGCIKQKCICTMCWLNSVKEEHYKV